MFDEVTTLAWVVIFGLAMAAVAMVGSVTLLLREQTLERLLLPLIGLAAGSLLGGAFFHLLPEGAMRSEGLDVWVSLAAGFVAFFVLEQFLHWHHCHQAVSRHKPVGHLILLADGIHNFIGGIAVGGAFVIDTRLGVITWLVAAVHEIPQELGDFGILIHSGWSHGSALAYNVASGLTFLVGGLVAIVGENVVDVHLLLPFAAGNFIYIASSDLIPQLKSTDARAQVEYFAALMLGLVAVLAVA